MSILSQRIGFVTGGGSGIGLACAQRMVERGAQVVIAGRREDTLAQAVAQLGPAASYAVCDVTNEAAVQQAIATVRQRHGRLDLAVNAAGSGSGGNIEQQSAIDFAQAIHTNLIGLYACLRAEAQAMLEQGHGGSIVNISSIAGVLPHRGMSAYCASKAAVNMLTRCQADDLGPRGIRVNAVMPGLVHTDIVAPLLQFQPAVDAYLARMPLARVGQPQDIAGLVAFLLSDEAAWITGQCIAADGGNTLRGAPDLGTLFGTSY